ncbi:class I SAM-dependent methyltransferase [Planktomarina temperata]|nr:class I SAM-dependent methyltransferase [Planktomarina temperata]
MFTEINCCRVCGNTNMNVVLDLGEQALTGVFPHRLSPPGQKGPVSLIKCNDVSGCGLVQLKQTYDPDLMYGENYGYKSSLNKSMIDHLRSKVEKIKSSGVLTKGDIVLDIGCNDGTTLRHFGAEYKRVGIDPTLNKFRDHFEENIICINQFFSKEVFKNIFRDVKAKVITSFSMFYDLPDPVKFATDVAKCLHDDGIWVFEQSYLPSMLETNSFDTICHEHLEFYSLKAVLDILERAGLKCLDVEFNNINGGSFSVIAALKTANISPNSKNIMKIIDEENIQGVHRIETFFAFRGRIETLRLQTRKLLGELKSNGEIIYGIGASTKGNVLLQYYELNDFISAIGEVNSDKFNCVTPGTGIPIASEETLLEDKNAYFFILPWHFREFFEKSEKFKGKKLIFPLPKLEIVQL